MEKAGGEFLNAHLTQRESFVRGQRGFAVGLACAFMAVAVWLPCPADADTVIAGSDMWVTPAPPDGGQSSTSTILEFPEDFFGAGPLVRDISG